MRLKLLIAIAILMSRFAIGQEANTHPLPEVMVATFDVDATPPVGFQMAYDPVKRIDELGLRCRGIVLLVANSDPIVICAVDWIGIGNGSHDEFRRRLAKAVDTTPDRVAVHTLHQHDAPASDLTAERLLIEAGVTDTGRFNSSVTRELFEKLEAALANRFQNASQVTHAGFGVANVDDVASNRRILGEDGKVRATRYTTTRDAKLRAEPHGTIDAELSCLSFWNADKPVAVLTYYACHPQSYYRTGIPSPDFPGIARFIRGQDVPGALHVHFNGAGGNIGAGKYNDGDKHNRVILANRLADGMKRAFDATKVFPIGPADIGWDIAPVALPPAKHLDRSKLEDRIKDWKGTDYWGAADDLAWLKRCQSGHKIDLSCLRIGDVRVLHMPGELFVEYQLAAKAMRPNLHVAMAAYGDYGPGYIGTQVAYEEGGYETSPRASKVDKSSERLLFDGIRKLLDAHE